MRQETLYTTCTVYREAVFVRQLFHSEDRDDILQLFVALQNLFDALSGFVVLFSDDQRIEDSRGGFERVDGRIDTELGDLTAQHGRGIQVGKGRCRSGVGQVIRRDVYGLNGGDGSLFG